MKTKLELDTEIKKLLREILDVKNTLKPLERSWVLKGGKLLTYISLLMDLQWATERSVMPEVSQ